MEITAVQFAEVCKRRTKSGLGMGGVGVRLFVKRGNRKSKTVVGEEFMAHFEPGKSKFS